MARDMVTSLIIVAAALSQPVAVSPGSPSLRRTVSASAHATARIMIISGVKFGQDYTSRPAGAARRPALLADADGQVRRAELLEFQ